MGHTGVEEMNLLLSGFFQRYVSFEPIEHIELSGQLDGSWEVHIPQFSDLSRGLDQVSLAFSWQEEHEFTAALEQQLAAGGQPAKNIEEEIQNCKHCPEEAIEGQQYEDADGKRYQYENGQWLEHIWTAPMLEPIPVKADRITAEGSSFWDWAKIGAEIAIGFTPFGVILDVIDLGKAIAGGNPTDIAIAMIGFLPAGKKIGGGLEKMLKHTDELAPFGVQPPKLQAPPKELEKLKELQKQVPEGPKAAKESPAIQNNDAPKVETPKAEPPKLEEPQLKEPELKEEIPLEKELGKQEAPEIEFGSNLPPKIYKLDDENFVRLQEGRLGKYRANDDIPRAEYEKLIKEYKREMSLIPKGFGKMAKDKAGEWYTTPKTLNEQLTLDEAMTDSGLGKHTEIYDHLTGDPRLPTNRIIAKWSYNRKFYDPKTKVRTENVEVHYLLDVQTGIKFDFKFKIK